MEKPNRFTAIHQITRETKEFNYIGLRPYVPCCGVDNWTIYEDTRYKAKLRLFNYFTYTRKGLEVPRYKPFAGTEIGKSIPILSF